MAKFFIQRPIFAIVLSLIISILGLISMLNLSVAQYPKISPPTVMISANYQGASADVVNDTVAQVIEQQVNGVDDMVSMSSTSTDSGSYSLSVQFEPDKDSDTATVQTQNRVSQATAALPSSVQSSGVTTTKASDDMSMIFQLYSPTDVYDAKFLKNYGSVYLVDNIKRVKGVGDVSEFGADYSMRIWLQPDKMAQLGVSTSEILSAIEKQNVQAPAGSLGQLPTDNKQDFQYTARIKGRLDDSKSFGDIIILAKSDGSAIHLKDVARVEMGSKDYSYDSKQNGHESAGFAIKLTSDANALETIGNVKKVLEDAKKNFPPNMDYMIAVDNTEFIKQSMIEVSKTFAEALLLVVFVVFLFLQTWRATLIPVLAIPVSLLGTFAAFTVLNFTINTLTLFAMVLAIGLVVDDAIVVIEAVEHHIRYEGLSPRDATVQAMAEVSGPVIAIAFVLASVFLPVAFFSGTVGILYKQFAITIAVSMALSALIALSLTPALCSLLLKPYEVNERQGRVGKFFARFNQWFETSVERYAQKLSYLIPKARLCMVFLLIMMIGIGLLYRVVPSSFVPEEDQGFYLAAVNLPEAASLNRTIDAMKQLNSLVSSQDGVERIMNLSGMDMMSGGQKSSAGVMFISLAPWENRTTSQLQVQSEVQKTFTASGQLPEGTVMAMNPPALPGLGMFGGFTLMLEDRGGGSLTDLDSIAQKFVAAAKERPEIGMIQSSFKSDTPGYEFEVDRNKAETLGVSVDDVFSTLQAFLGGSQVNDFTKFGRNYKVIVQAEGVFRSDINSLRYLYVKSSDGNMVPVATLVTPKKVTAPSVITRFNGVNAVKISGSQAAGYSSGQAMTALEQVAAQTLPSTYTYEWSGQSREEKQASGRTPIIFTAAILFVFLCLAALYESWSIPFAVLLAIPSGIFGAFLFQYARGLENSIYMQIGLIMLIGLAGKNAILIVEFAKVRVDKGLNPVTAAIEASKLRLRPIIMTSLAFIIGCLPLMLATGAGAGARTSMGTAVVGGMLAATTIGIFLIPVLFVVVEKIVAAISEKR